MGAVMYCRRRRLDQMCQFRFDQYVPNECAGQFTIGRLNRSSIDRYSTNTGQDASG